MRWYFAPAKGIMNTVWGLDVKVLTAILVPPSQLVCVVHTTRVLYNDLGVLA